MNVILYFFRRYVVRRVALATVVVLLTYKIALIGW